tara:strand:- start:1187 stop:1645 length:459 start_codon:yes stop_codon:yes gene_type:complete
MFKKIILFLMLNFGALAIGSYFTDGGASSDWYQNLNKAPWTPAGWVFGAAWTSIMICYSVYMAYLIKINRNTKKIILLYSIQWILNVSWNPIFFELHLIILGLIEICLLTTLITYLCIHFWKELKTKTLLIFPYLIWLLIASSLNAYIACYN